MKKILIRSISIFLTLAIFLGFIPILQSEVKAVTLNQQNIADRADFFFNATWVCQKDVNAWRDEFVFRKGETYHLPYGQPVNSGKFIGYGVELDDFLAAAADGSSVFYSRQSEFNGWTSVYYATDCAAFVAMCWGTVRQDCSTLPYYSTYKGRPTEANIHSILQLGDALDSTSVGHVVLVSDLIYDDSGKLVQIEITEQTPPQLKRTYFTPSELAAKYGEEFGIYRYEGSVPAVPERGYTTECTNYASYGSIQITEDTPIMSLPCDSTVQADSIQISSAVKGETYTATRLYNNTAKEFWYRITYNRNKEGYVLAKNTLWQDMMLDDIMLSDAVYPNAHVKGKTFSLVGNIYSRYNQLVTASGYIYQGFGSNGLRLTGGTDYVTGNAYTLKQSQIDYSTSFGNLAAGNYSMVYSADYRNYHVVNDKVIENTGTVELAQEYFMVVSSASNQSACNHNYSKTTITDSSCVETGLSVFACSNCGKVYKQQEDALGHTFGSWDVTAATCDKDGVKIRTCSICRETESEVLKALGHDYSEEYKEADCEGCAHYIYCCTICGDSYVVYPEEVMTPWQEELPENIDKDLIESKEQYRTSELKVTLSAEKELEGHTFMGETWETVSEESVSYVKQFPSGFDTTNALYAQYHKTPMTGNESETEKLVIESDNVTGYLYYHWCYPNSYFSQSSKGGQYTTFHAYYSTTKPDTYRVDTSDWSYCTAHETCTNTQWYFVAEVNTQSVTKLQKLYQQGQWQAYSDWSDTPAESNETLRVEKRTVYRYPNFNATGHQYGKLEIKPTCTTDGSITKTCVICGDVQTETIPATGHNYTVTVKPATCTESGHTTYTCDCGYSYTGDMVDALGHSYEYVTIEATCTQDGSHSKNCSVCGDQQVEIIPAIGHQFKTVIKEPTCTESGFTTYICSCGYTETKDATDPLGHSYTLITVDATCLESGSVTKTCDRCDDSQVEIIPPKGHQYEAVVTAPTCLSGGYTTYACICGDHYVTDEIPATDHNYKVESIEATCTENGSINAICTTCGYTKSGIIPATGHQYENGICINCGEKEAAQIVMPTLTLRSPTLEFKDTICIVAFYTADHLDDVVEMGMITYSKKVSEWNVDTAEHIIPGYGYDEASGRYYSNSHGIHAKYLADTVYLACYAKLKDGNYVYSKLAPYSPITYAKSQLKNSSDVTLKQLVVSMLNYGTEAQVYFGHNIGNLANASLTAEQAALPEAYRQEMAQTVGAVSAYKQGTFANNQGFRSRIPAISFEGAFCINYFFTPNYTPSKGITLYYWYETDYNPVTVLTPQNASGSLALNGSGTGQYRGDITGIAAKNLSQAIYVAAVYSDGTTTWTSGVLGYSIGAYCSSQAAKGGDVADLAMATAIYGYYAKQYFS